MDLTLHNKRQTVANGASGVLSLSSPVSVTGTDGNVAINLAGYCYDVPFTVSQSIEANGVLMVEFDSTYTDRDMYVTNCVVDSL